jgi:hypothetical protein
MQCVKRRSAEEHLIFFDLIGKGISLQRKKATDKVVHMCCELFIRQLPWVIMEEAALVENRFQGEENSANRLRSQPARKVLNTACNFQ